MPLEIERKFLVASDAWRATADEGKRLRQAYLASSNRIGVRVRIAGDDRAVLTLKGARSGATREEFEYAIPPDDAKALMALATGAVIEKTRYIVNHGAHAWEIDVFAGDNEGLIVAEVELADVGEAFDRPDWLGEEVTHDRRYYNAALAGNPYRNWQPQVG